MMVTGRRGFFAYRDCSIRISSRGAIYGPQASWLPSQGRRETCNSKPHPPSLMPSSRKMGSSRCWLEAAVPLRATHASPQDCVLYPIGSCYIGVPGDLGMTKGRRVSARRQLWAALWEVHWIAFVWGG